MILSYLLDAQSYVLSISVDLKAMGRWESIIHLIINIIGIKRSNYNIYQEVKKIIKSDWIAFIARKSTRYIKKMNEINHG